MSIRFIEAIEGVAVRTFCAGEVLLAVQGGVKIVPDIGIVAVQLG
jgi:hypothetical protein